MEGWEIEKGKRHKVKDPDPFFLRRQIGVFLRFVDPKSVNPRPDPQLLRKMSIFQSLLHEVKDIYGREPRPVDSLHRAGAY